MSVPVVPALIGSLLGWPFKEAAKVGLSATSGWIVAGAQAILAEVVKVISLVSTPSLSASWFSASYWRIAGLAMLLTVPFLFAAAVQAVVRTDLGVLIRAAFVDLPVAVLAVTLTGPLVALLLAATDEMCAVVTGGGTAGGSFLTATGSDLGTMRGGFMLAVIAVVILLAGMFLMVELIMRAAAIYIVVLFLPLGFAAMVWPARRVWVKRMVETLIALILSKFAMVAILSVAVSSLASLTPSLSSLTTALTAMALMVLAAFSPWALLRLLPFTEIAAGAGAMLHHETREGGQRAMRTAPHAAALAAEPVGAAFDAIGRLVQSGSSDSSGGAGGRGVLGSGSASRTRNQGGVRGPAAPDAAGGEDATQSHPSFDERSPVLMGAVSSSGGGASPEDPTNGASGGGAPGDGRSSGAPGGGSGSAASSAIANLGPNPAQNVGARPDFDAPAKSPIAELSPIFHPDNERMELNLRGDGSGWLVSPGDGAAGVGEPVGEGALPAPEDGLGGGVR